MSIPAEFFEEDYREEQDPFHYEGNDFELIKYHAQLALLTDRRFVSALELGSSIGVFTALLAPRCDRLLAIDCAPSAIARVRERCRGIAGVTAQVALLPTEFPAGMFDLVTFAEFGYYLNASDLAALRWHITAATSPGASLVLTHVTGEYAPYMGHTLPSTHEEVHAPFQADPNWEHRRRLKGYEGDMSGPELYWCDLFERV